MNTSTALPGQLTDPATPATTAGTQPPGIQPSVGGSAGIGAETGAAWRLPPVPADTPLPVRPHSERVPGLRRVWTRAACRLNQALARTPGMRQLYEGVLRRTLQITPVAVTLARGVRAHGDGAHGDGARGATDRGAPHPLRGLRIAVVSDVHAGSYVGAAALEEVAHRVVRTAPDLICLPGDLINTRESELELLVPFLRALKAPLGVFAVPGNHDHTWCADMGRWHDAIETTGVQVLTNRGVRLTHGDGTLWLAGVDDYAEGEVDLTAAMAGRRESEPCVLMAHHPDYFAESLRADVDLTVSGHTHGGQVRLGPWVPMRHTKLDYLSGHFEVAQRHLVVSRGIGATLLPLRLGAPPEVPIVELR